MKILLIQPPVRDFYDTNIRLQPIGLGYLKASILKQFPSAQVFLKDYHAGWGRKTIPWPAEFHSLKPFYGEEDKSPFSTFHHFYHFGADYKTIAEDVRHEKPDLVGISSLFSPYYRETLATAEAIKQVLNVFVFVGGSHVSALPETVLSHPAVDLVILGEGEHAIGELLKAWQNKKGFTRVPGCGFKKKGKMVFTKKKIPRDAVESLIPNISDLPKSNYLYESKPLCFILTSRGCPYRCSFCSVHKTFGHHYRRRSNTNILKEIRLRYEQGYRVFDLEDDNLTFEKKAALELFNQLGAMFPARDTQFVAMNGICYWDLDRSLLVAMKHAGFTHLNLSLVSSNRVICGTLHRPLNLEKYKTVAKNAFDLGFKTVAYQILGLPNESLTSAIKTLGLNARLPVLLGASPFYIPPGSEIAACFRGTNPYSDSRLTCLGPEAGSWTRKDVYTLFVTTRILNFLKSLTFDRDTTLNEVLKHFTRKDPRSKAGAKILEMLLSGKGFHVWNKHGFTFQPNFNQELFWQTWESLKWIKTCRKIKIRL